MLKNLTLLAVAGLLVNTGCIITSGNDSESDSATATNNTTEGTGTDGTTTTGGTTDGTATGTDGTTTGTDTTTDTPTTGTPTTGTVDTTTDGTTDATTTDATGTTGPSNYGNCGWNVDVNYYDCYPGGEPGLVDPDPNDPAPIDCPDTLPEDGDPCGGVDSPVSNLGCCTPEGVLFYCTTPEEGGTIVIQECTEGP